MINIDILNYIVHNVPYAIKQIFEISVKNISNENYEK